MNDVETGRFTVAVFQDVAWAQKGLDALRQIGLAAESLTILAKADPAVATLIEQTLGFAGEPIELASVGPVLGHGPLIEPLQGTTRTIWRSWGWPARCGVSDSRRTTRRIFETLTGRGGVLVAIRSEPRAADALAILHSYGGGNAAIGAWTGRV